MRRRDFLASLAVAVSGTVRASGQPAAGNAGRRIQTVRGAVPVEALGMTLPHEHVLVDFVGADRVSPSRYDADAAFQKALPFLERVRQLGGRTLVECTPAFLGRDVRLLERLSEARGERMMTYADNYGAD